MYYSTVYLSPLGKITLACDALAVKIWSAYGWKGKSIIRGR